MTPTPSETLADCPFCGAHKIAGMSRDFAGSIFCDNCGAQAPKDIWNLRAIAQPPDAMREALENIVSMSDCHYACDVARAALASSPAAGTREEDRVIEGREDWYLLAHEINAARDVYLNGMGQEGNAERKKALEQLLWNDKGTIAIALRAAALASTPPASPAPSPEHLAKEYSGWVAGRMRGLNIMKPQGYGQIEQEIVEKLLVELFTMLAAPTDGANSSGEK